MKPITLILTQLFTGFAFSQSPQPPEELKHIAFMTGEWKAKVAYNFPGMEPITCDSTVKEEVVYGGMFHKTIYVVEGVPGFGKIEGTMFTTYDSTQKAYRSWAFDNTAPICLESSGAWDGKKLVMTSKPVDMGMGPMTFRWTYEKISETQIKFLMEIKMETDFQKTLEGVYTKKAG